MVCSLALLRSSICGCLDDAAEFVQKLQVTRRTYLSLIANRCSRGNSNNDENVRLNGT